MPCHSDWGDWAEDDYKRIKKELDDITKVLCSCCKQMEKSEVSIPPDTTKWWERHKEVDAKRRKEDEEKRYAESLRNAALAKLTPAERKALGV